MKRITTAIAVAAAALLTLGVILAVSTTGSAASAGHVALRMAASGSDDVVSYDSEGVTVAPPVTTTTVPAPAAATAQSVMDSFRAQAVPSGVVGKQIDSAPHTVSQAQVTETMPTSGQVVAGVPYSAWVVTYTGLPPVSYAPAPAPAGLSCTFVGVMSRATGAWTEFFTSCS